MTGGLRARASTRELALSLELNKDTVTRALAKLRACGVITVVDAGRCDRRVGVCDHACRLVL